MASVTRVRELFGESVAVESERNTPHITAKRRFQVIFDDVDGTVAQAINAVDPTTPAYAIPNNYDGHPDDSRTRVRAKTATQDADVPKLWIVDVDYDSKVSTNASNENPLLAVPEVEWGFSTFMRAMPKIWEKQGATFVLVAPNNSAGDPFDPPPETEIICPTLRIQRNESSFGGGATQVNYVGKTNTLPFWGGLVDQVKCCGIAARLMFANRFFFWQVTYEFQFREDKWTIAPLDQGAREKIVVSGGGNELKTIIDKRTHLPAGVVPLDNNGHPLAAGAPPAFRGPWYPFTNINFGPLALDPPTVPFP